MEVKHIFGRSSITESEKEKQVDEILTLLKEKKQTYTINKFVLEEAIRALEDMII